MLEPVENDRSVTEWVVRRRVHPQLRPAHSAGEWMSRISSPLPSRIHCADSSRGWSSAMRAAHHPHIHTLGHLAEPLSGPPADERKVGVAQIDLVPARKQKGD